MGTTSVNLRYVMRTASFNETYEQYVLHYHIKYNCTTCIMYIVDMFHTQIPDMLTIQLTRSPVPTLTMSPITPYQQYDISYRSFNGSLTKQNSSKVTKTIYVLSVYYWTCSFVFEFSATQMHTDTAINQTFSCGLLWICHYWSC